MICPLIRIDTNQGLVGYGEVRDGANERYALSLKSRVVGENPCNVDRIFRKIKQFGGHARQAGGVCGIEMALMDLAGKAWGVPCWQMLGGRFRDRVRLYADTTEAESPKEQGERLKARMALGHHVPEAGLRHQPAGEGSRHADDAGRLQLPPEPGGHAPVHRHRDHRQGDRLARRMGRDGRDRRSARRSRWPPTTTATSASTAASSWPAPWRSTTSRGWRTWCRGSTGDLLKQIKDNTTTPILTGEDIFLKEEFIKLIDMEAVDMIHPDLASAGGLMETKKIGDYAMEHGVPMAMHFAGTPISFMANVHCAAATENFIALEHHSIDVPWWESMVTTPKPMIEKGFAIVPDLPGLGVELNEEVVKAHLAPNATYFAPTPEWDTFRSNDRLWS